MRGVILKVPLVYAKATTLLEAVALHEGKNNYGIQITLPDITITYKYVP